MGYVDIINLFPCQHWNGNVVSDEIIATGCIDQVSKIVFKWTAEYGHHK